MTTTLPGSIPGLVRRGSPVIIDHNHPSKNAVVAAKYTETAIVSTATFAAEKRDTTLALDITDPTGFSHALLYLAKHYRLPSVNGLLWRRIRVTGGAYKGWCLENGQGEVRIPNLDVDDPVEALRLAVLAVAGVQA